MLRPLLALATAGTLVLAMAACANDDDNNPAGDESSLDVVAAFYPFQFAAERVGGTHVSVTNLSAPGVEPHDLELTPSQVAAISESDLVVFLGGFQPAVDEAVETNAADTALDAAEVVPLLDATVPDEHAEEAGEEEHEEPESPFDLHFWLDATRLASFAGELANALGTRDPDNAAEYTANAEALGGELAALDTEYTEGLAGCERREIVTSHAAFGYLADRYDLEQIAITGLSPEEEPTPERLAEVTHEAEEHGATTIFFETLVSPAISEVIADQVGAQTAVLDPIEGLTPDSNEDYLSLMRNNLGALRAALGCP